MIWSAFGALFLLWFSHVSRGPVENLGEQILIEPAQLLSKNDPGWACPTAAGKWLMFYCLIYLSL